MWSSAVCLVGRWTTTHLYNKNIFGPLLNIWGEDIVVAFFGVFKNNLMDLSIVQSISAT